MKNLIDEKRYDFRARIYGSHTQNIRDFSVPRRENEIQIKDGYSFEFQGLGEIVCNAIADFKYFMKNSLSVESGENGGIKLMISGDLGEYNTYKGRRVVVDDTVTICAFDERGLAQAIYDLEDILALRRAPYLEKGTYYRKPMYSPMLLHSGFAYDAYPNEYLVEVAKSGRDAIMINVRNDDLDAEHYRRYNEIIERAARFGIDTYAYSNIKSNKHPLDIGAREHYEGTYGALFGACPGFRGVVLCGESVEFPSRDERVSDKPYYANYVDGIHTGKLSPGWFPCRDYPDWLRLIQSVIYAKRPDADIIFWTYNWFKADEADRIALIENLPEGITLQATFEMGGDYKLGDYTDYSADYSLALSGPCDYFTSEAKAASKRGLKMYSMTNTGGRTWDFGLIPIEPMPMQWQKRYKAMEKIHDEFGLAGIMECHDYGFTPSFLTRLSKWTFSEPRIPYDKLLRGSLQIEYGSEYLDEITKSLELWSEAITYYTPTAADQYGAFRVGPSYPFNLDRVARMQADPNSMDGDLICTPTYMEQPGNKNRTFLALRMPEEIRSLEKMRDIFKSGLDILDSLEAENENLLYLINLGHYMYCCIVTGLNAKRWYMLKCDAKAERCREKLISTLESMQSVLDEERVNAEDALQYVKKDSLLGWSPSTEYLGDEWHIEWKLRQLEYVNKELDTWKKSARA